MKLKYSYRLDTWAEDSRYGSEDGPAFTIGPYEVEFSFNDNHRVTRVNVLIQATRLYRSDTGALDATRDEDARRESFGIVNYLSNVLFVQTGKCDFSDYDSLVYVPDTDGERRQLEGGTFVVERNLSMNASIIGRPDFSQTAFIKYLDRVDALAMYVDARKMNNITGKYREFFRVIEHFFPFKGPRFDAAVNRYLVGFDPRFTQLFINKLRDLRNRCSHSKRIRDYITSSNPKGMKEIRSKLSEIQRIAKYLLENPPP